MNKLTNNVLHNIVDNILADENLLNEARKDAELDKKRSAALLKLLFQLKTTCYGIMDINESV
jgi:hypothetical protein